MPVPDSGPDNRLPEQIPRPKRGEAWLLRGMFAAYVLTLTAGFYVLLAAEPRNSVRERRTPAPPIDVTLRHDGAWLMPCSATPDTRPCPIGVTCLYRNVQDGPDGFPTSIVREECLTEADELVVPVLTAVPIVDTAGEHCLLDEDRCTQVAQDTCRIDAGLPPGTRVRLVKKTFEMGKLCTFTCPNGKSFSCSTPPTQPQPKPGDVTLIQ